MLLLRPWAMAAARGQAPLVSVVVPAAASAVRRAKSTDSSAPVVPESSRPYLEPDYQIYEALQPRTAILMKVQDRVGALHDILRWFWKYDVNITHIESRPGKAANSFEFFVDFEASPNEATTQALLGHLSRESESIMTLGHKEVPWFPRHISELDVVANRVLDAGIDLESDHPGFKDPEYRARRAVLAENAMRHRYGNPLPHINYSPDEVKTWGAVYNKLTSLIDQFACDEYKKILLMMQQHCGYDEQHIPQQADISNFLRRTTGFQLRPVAGLLSSRDFLNGLAFRVFFCTQYIRHHSVPLYTPEPDIVHELMGHAPMFADNDFADFSQEIGLASLGASDEDIMRLARCYWHSVEFGVCKQGNDHKAYGAGLLSSFGELEYSCAPYRPAGDTDQMPEYRPWDPHVAAETEFPITTYQPTYFVADSLSDAKHKMREFCEAMQKPFYARYNPNTDTVWVDRAVRGKLDDI